MAWKVSVECVDVVRSVRAKLASAQLASESIDDRYLHLQIGGLTSSQPTDRPTVSSKKTQFASVRPIDRRPHSRGKVAAGAADKIGKRKWLLPAEEGKN